MTGSSHGGQGGGGIPGEGTGPESVTFKESASGAPGADPTISDLPHTGGPGQGHAIKDLPPGTVVDHFVVKRLLGEGGMGRVYLARDTTLGRRVALKVLSPQIFGTAGALDDFLREARITARFSHPHIVGIYAVGEHQGEPYLALEYLEGQTLQERIAEGAVGPREAARVGIAVAEALREAHAIGVLHRDLKPSNILIPRDGRPRVVDFGLARATQAGQVPRAREGSGGGAGESWEGSPLYMSPEQWLGAADTPATDIWSLGLILHELATGRHPMQGRTMNELVAFMLQPDPVPLGCTQPEVPAELCAVIQLCLNKDPEPRPTAELVVDMLESVARGRRGGWDPSRQSPYRGLLPFGEQHADLFFGREAEVDAFVERLRDEPTITVVGPSGAGKSSFVRGGVIPRLRDQGSWTALSMRPGSRPFNELARTLIGDPGSTSGISRRRSSEEEELAARLQESPARLTLELGAIHERQGNHVLLLLDQTEELFTMVEDATVRRRFLEAILTAADDAADPVRVVLTIRDDFFYRLVEGTSGSAALDRMLILRTPDERMLEQVLTRPLAAAGFRFEDPEMVAEMIASVSGEVACLPLLEFAARLLWERRDSAEKVIRREVFNEMGGVAGALVNHADAVLEGLTREGQGLARQMLTRLVTPVGTRRILSRDRVLEGLTAEADEVLDRLVQARLLTVLKRTGEGGKLGPNLELVHESLVATWRRLARWLEESREDLLFLDEVGQAAELWQKRGSRSEELWQGDALHEALRMLGRCRDQAPEQVAQFLEAGRRRQANRRRRRRLLTSGIIAGLVLVVVVLAYQARVADSQRAEAQSRRAEALREGARAALSQGKVLEARAKLRAGMEVEDAQMARALWWQLRDEPLVWNKDLGAFVYGLTFLHPGNRLAVASRDGSIYVLDVRTQAVKVLRGHDDQVFSIASSRSGARLASGSWNGKVLLWDLAAGKVTHTLKGHSSGVFGVDFGPGGKVLASSSWKGKVRLWAADTGAQIREMPGDPKGTRGVRLSPDGKLLLTWGLSSTLQLREVATGRLVRTLSGHGQVVVTGIFNAAAGLIASGSKDGTVRLWDVATGAQRRSLLHPGKSATYGLSFSPGGELLASAGSDKIVRVWRVATGELVHTFTGHTAAIYGVTFSPDGLLLASGGSDRTVKLWRVGKAARARVSSGHASAVEGVRFTPDGRSLVSVSSDQTVRVWDVMSGRQTRTLRGHTDGIYGVAISPDGSRVASAARDRDIRLWDVASGHGKVLFKGHMDAARGVAFSPDGRRLVSGGSDRTLRIWDVQSGRQLRVLKGHADGILGIALSPDGRLAASAGADGSVGLWELDDDGEALPIWLKGH